MEDIKAEYARSTIRLIDARIMELEKQRDSFDQFLSKIDPEHITGRMLHDRVTAQIRAKVEKMKSEGKVHITEEWLAKTIDELIAQSTKK